MVPQSQGRSEQNPAGRLMITPKLTILFDPPIDDLGPIVSVIAFHTIQTNTGTINPG